MGRPRRFGSALTVLAFLAVTACGDQDQPVNDGLPNRAESDTPAIAPAEPSAPASTAAGVEGTDAEPPEELSQTDSFSIERALGQLPEQSLPNSGTGYTVADIEQAFDWLGPVEEVWRSENHTGTPTVGDWFWAANVAGSRPPQDDGTPSTPDFILNVRPEWFGGEEERAGFDLGLPVRETRFVAQGVGGGVLQLYAQFESGLALPPVLEDQGEGLYLIPASAASPFRNSEGQKWRLGTRDEEVLIDRSVAKVRAWTLEDPAGSLREDSVLMETAGALDDLGIAVAHIYPSPRRTIVDDLRESREPDRDTKLEELRYQIRLKIPCEAAAIGWFDESGEPRELILYHFGNASTASEALPQVEAAWSDQLNDKVRDIGVRDIRQEGSIVYVVPEDLTETGRLASLLTGMAESGDLPFTCGAINPF